MTPSFFLVCVLKSSVPKATDSCKRMRDRALPLVLVLHLAAFAVALSDSPKARLGKDAGSSSSSVPAPLHAPPTRRVILDGAPVGGAPECPCLPMDSPKLDDARAAFELKGLPVRRLLPTARQSPRTPPPHAHLVASLRTNPVHAGITQRLLTMSVDDTSQREREFIDYKTSMVTD